MRVGAAVGVALLLALGVLTGIDDMLVGRVARSAHAPAAGSERVALVYFDEATLGAWPDAGWTWAEHGAVLRRVLAGGARAVVVVDYGPGGGPAGPVPDDLAAAARDGRLFLPAGRVPPPPRLALTAAGTYQLAVPDALAPTPIDAALTALGHRRAQPLDIAYLANPPTVPAHRVASGEIIASTFRDRVVLVGSKAGPLAVGMPTPAGALSAAELQLHAVATALGGAASTVVGLPGRALAAVLALLLLLGLEHLRPRSVGVVAVGGVALLAGGGAALGVWWGWYLPPTLPLLGVGVALAVIADRRASALDAQIARLATWADREATRAAAATALDPWPGFATASRALVEAHSTLLAELPAGTWHLEFRASAAVALTDIVEPRRDVRRDPYRDAYARQRPSWATRELVRVDGGVRTLVVPLVGMNQVLGMWFVNYPADATVAAPTLQRIEQLARQLAATLLARRVATASSEPGDASRLAELARALQRGVALADERDQLRAVDAASHVGELVATPWGQIESINDELAALLRSAGIDGVRAGDGPGVAPLLATLTGVEQGAVEAMLRDLLDRPGAVRLAARLEPMLGPARIYDLTLGMRTLDAHGGRRIVLTAVRRADEPLAPAPWLWQADAATDARVPVDLSALLGRILAEQQRRGAARPLHVELPPSCEVALADGPVREALSILVGEIQHGPAAAAPAALRVRDTDDEVGVELVDPALVLTEIDVRAIRAGDLSAPDTPLALVPLVRASQLVRDAQAELTVRSDVASGTTICVTVRRRGAR